MLRRFFSLHTSALVILALASGCAHPDASPKAASPSAALGTQPNNMIQAKDSRFHYAGRVDTSLANGIGLIWEASSVSIDFEGNQLNLVFAKAEGANFFDIRIDEQSAIIEVPAGNEHEITCPLVLGSGRHQATLFKRSEAHAGFVIFAGVKLAEGAQARTPAKLETASKFEFFGDSITVGACNEDGAVDQWESRRTHNSAFSYAALTAAAFRADYRNISVSGMGIVTGYVDIHAPHIWDRLYPSESSVRADLKQWTPSVVFVNYGENDISFTTQSNQPFPSSFVDEYVGMVRAMRTVYPLAEIVILRGGMGGGAENLTLRAAWDSVALRLEAEDPKITHFVFTHFSLQHPRVSDDQAMAAELIAWLRKQKFMRL